MNSRRRAAAAIAGTLEAELDGLAVYDRPPGSFVAPAAVVQFPAVNYNVPAFGVDNAPEWTVLFAVGIDEADELDELLDLARAALNADERLAGGVQHCRTVGHRNARIIAVAGVDYLTAELVLDIRL
jgi:hypothetical protein